MEEKPSLDSEKWRIRYTFTYDEVGKEIAKEVGALERKFVNDMDALGIEVKTDGQLVDEDIERVQSLANLVNEFYANLQLGADSHLEAGIILEWFKYNFCTTHPNAGVRRADTLLQVAECPVCGKNHARLPFLRLDTPVGDFTHWTPCPTTGEPVFVNEEDGG